MLKSKSLIHWLLYSGIVVSVAFSTGCQFAGLIALLGTESIHEKKIPAEFDLTQHTESRILVLVNQMPYINSEVNLRYHLSKGLHKELANTIKVPVENIISYTALSDFRSSTEDFSLLSPAEIGAGVDADLVLSVTIEAFYLPLIPDVKCHRGSLSTQCSLFDVATGERLWPKSLRSKGVRVGFEADCHGLDVAAARLVVASSYCTVRFLHNCPKVKFTVQDDKTMPGRAEWEDWGK